VSEGGRDVIATSIKLHGFDPTSLD
jgi:hypothetical protein